MENWILKISYRLFDYFFVSNIFKQHVNFLNIKSSCLGLEAKIEPLLGADGSPREFLIHYFFILFTG